MGSLRRSTSTIRSPTASTRSSGSSQGLLSGSVPALPLRSPATTRFRTRRTGISRSSSNCLSISLTFVCRQPRRAPDRREQRVEFRPVDSSSDGAGRQATAERTESLLWDYHHRAGVSPTIPYSYLVSPYPQFAGIDGNYIDRRLLHLSCYPVQSGEAFQSRAECVVSFTGQKLDRRLLHHLERRQQHGWNPEYLQQPGRSAGFPRTISRTTWW